MERHDILAVPLDSRSAGLTTRVHKNATFFSTSDFVTLWSRFVRKEQRLLAIPVRGSGPPRTMYGVQTPTGRWSLHVSLAPD